MKRLRIASLIILLCACASIGYIRVKHGQAGDSIAPVISMGDGSALASIKISVKDDESVILEDAVAKDNRDGDVTETITIDSISPFNADGKRYATLAAFDKSNNVGKASREVVYSDYHSPHFDITEPLAFNTGTTDFLGNITATDVLDGDLTSNIHFADNTSISSDTPGDYEVKLQVKNSAGDTATLPVTVTILDSSYSEKPRVHLKHYVRYVEKGGDVDFKKLVDYVEISGSEYELVDGDDIDEEEKTIGRDRIHISDDEVNYDKAGIYEVTYKVSQVRMDETITGKTSLILVVED